MFCRIFEPGNIQNVNKINVTILEKNLPNNTAVLLALYKLTCVFVHVRVCVSVCAHVHKFPFKLGASWPARQTQIREDTTRSD